METIAVSKLRENMVLFLKKVQQGKSIAITSRGNEIAIETLEISRAVIERATQAKTNAAKDPAFHSTVNAVSNPAASASEASP